MGRTPAVASVSRTSAIPPSTVSTAATSLPSSASDPNDYTYLNDVLIRWNPCQTITWGLNEGSGPVTPPNAEQEARDAYNDLSAKTGLTFQETSYDQAMIKIEIRQGNDPSLQRIYGWSTSDDYGQWRSNGHVVLSANLYYVGTVLRHETGHVLGLGHAQGYDEIMYRSSAIGPHAWGAGDLTGLHKIGKQPGEC